MTNKNCAKRNVQDKINKDIYEVRAMRFFLGLLLYPGDYFCMHEETFYALCRCCEFCVMWFWCMNVAVPDTEKEITVPLQSPQLSQAYQG